MIEVFDSKLLKKLYKSKSDSSNEDNGSVTIIGGSKLFHGAPILSMKVASRIVDMVFFTSPDPSVGKIAEKIKSKLMSFIWVPWEDVDAYIEKSDAVLIGPGFMRFGSEKTPEHERHHDNHDEGKETREITRRLLTKYPNKRWVIDAGSLQVMDAEWIPEGTIITPNRKEFEMLFKVKGPRTRTSSVRGKQEGEKIKEMAEKYKCTIVLKGPKTVVCSPEKCTVVKGGNAGLTKGGTGDVLAGLTVALFAQNDAHLSACAASCIEKKAADELYNKVGTNYNADDLADKIPSLILSL